MKRMILILLITVLSFSLLGCISLQDSLLAGNYYLGSTHTNQEGEKSVIVIFFDETQGVHIVDAGLATEEEQRKSYYGTYTCEKNVFSLRLSEPVSDTEYDGVIINNGAKIQIGKDEFFLTDLHQLTTKTRDVFE